MLNYFKPEVDKVKYGLNNWLWDFAIKRLLEITEKRYFTTAVA